MEFEAAVSYGSGKAVFKINKENPGIYCATLLNFNGKGEQCPSRKITLIRGVRCWTGSDNDVRLMNALGDLIEEHLSSTRRKQHSR